MKAEKNEGNGFEILTHPLVIRCEGLAKLLHGRISILLPIKLG